MYKIQALNNISEVGLARLPDGYDVADNMENPDAILLRSFDMHSMDFPASLKAVGRAGAGVNNIPVDKLSQLGVPVFNAPGANANAVKELVIAGMLMAARNICQAWDFARQLEGADGEISKAVESGKKNFRGFELPGRTLSVVGLGAIGVHVANAALDLGMKVYGYDPQITVRSAWQLSSKVEQANNINELLKHADFVTFHVPLVDATREMINAGRLEKMRDDVTILNFARNGIVDDDAVVAALDSGKVHAYVCDFPSNLLKQHPKVITLPHLGASTTEAEDNCAVMVADEVREYLENGNISNSVNFPEVSMPRGEGARLSVANANVPNMVGQISTCLGEHKINIIDMVNMSKGDLAYTLVDVEGELNSDLVGQIAAIEGVLSVRSI